MAQTVKQRVAVTALAAIGSAPLSYFFQRVLAAWGILDSVSDELGRWLKVNISPEAAGWTIALIVVLVLYGLLLWKVWKPHHVHHEEAAAQTKSEDSLGVKAQPAPGRPTDNTFVGSVHEGLARGSGNTVVDFKDELGSTILNRGGTAIGSGAQANDTGMAIGSGARAGSAHLSCGSLSSAELRDRAVRRAAAIRSIIPTTPLHPFDANQALAQHNATTFAFRQYHRSEAQMLLSEIRRRLGISEYPLANEYRSVAIDDGVLAGVDPLGEAANILEQLADRLPRD